MSGESKPYTTRTKESIEKFEKGWEAIFGNKLKEKKNGIRKRGK